MKNFQQDGKKINWVNGTSADVSAGDMVKVGDRVGVCSNDITDGATGVVTLIGVFKSIPKLSTDVVAMGVDLYWDDTNKRLTLTSTSNTLAGMAYIAAGNGVTTVTIKINA